MAAKITGEIRQPDFIVASDRARPEALRRRAETIENVVPCARQVKSCIVAIAEQQKRGGARFPIDNVPAQRLGQLVSSGPIALLDRAIGDSAEGKFVVWRKRNRVIVARQRLVKPRQLRKDGATIVKRVSEVWLQRNR